MERIVTIENTLILLLANRMKINKPMPQPPRPALPPVKSSAKNTNNTKTKLIIGNCGESLSFIKNKKLVAARNWAYF